MEIMEEYNYKPVQVITLHDAMVPSGVRIETIREAAEKHIKRKLGNGFRIEISTDKGKEEIDFARNETIATRHFDINKIDNHKEEENKMEKQSTQMCEVTVTAVYKGFVPEGTDMETIKGEMDEHFPTTDFEIELKGEADTVDFKFDSLVINKK
ncbi:hypothetical protein EZS27_010047 [termite gut metagenome]|uniref:Uncharacterized protein n=1 Tax=termite gut metagenome TaxID=433724 RepID=A0A5J4SAC3_9ZZZZ